MTENFAHADIHFMRMALELAKNGEGRVSPNPPVGCVLVRGGEVVGRGWHNRLGDLHAEAMALKDAGEKAKDAVAYVTLSPCATHGRQPPCADALIHSGVKEVVAACEDPNPRNASGLDVLRKAGIAVRSGLLREEAEYLARGFFSLQRRGRPFLTFKYAMTLDGKIGTVTGDSRWISCRESRQLVHMMRSRHDAIMIGSGTARADDPLLTVREPALSARGGPANHPQPFRVIVDSRARLCPEAVMLAEKSVPAGKVLLATTETAVPARITELRAAGAEILEFSAEDGHVPLEELLKELGRRGMAMVLFEGGGTLASSFLKANLVDEVVAFIAPKMAGGQSAPGPVGGMGLSKMAEALRLTVRECLQVGDDIVIRAGFLPGEPD